MPPNGFVGGLKPPVCADSVGVNKDIEEREEPVQSSTATFQFDLKWGNLIGITLLHIMAIYAIIEAPYKATRYLVLWCLFIGGVGAFGVTAGAHRLWTHRSYKAKLPLRIILALCYSVAGQNRLADWVRDHRVHHKYSETDADPHNSNRGFFFAHVGWLLQKKHPEVIKKGRVVDMSDVLSDPVVQFHQKYFWFLQIFMCVVLPSLVPYYFWNEEYYISFFGTAVVRYACSLNFTWLVNSAAHIWGNRPYDTRISPTENLTVAILAYGEGWHNYHHVFPWDYKAAELGDYKFNVTTALLDMFAKIGWAYDMKQPSKELIQKISDKYGDGSHVGCPTTHEVDENGQVLNCCQPDQQEESPKKS